MFLYKRKEVTCEQSLLRSSKMSRDDPTASTIHIEHAQKSNVTEHLNLVLKLRTARFPEVFIHRPSTLFTGPQL